MTSFNLLNLSRQKISSLSVTLLPLSLAHENKLKSCRLESCTRRYSSSSSSSGDKILTVSSINQNLVELRYEVRGAIAKRADKIRRELKV